MKTPSKLLLPLILLLVFAAPAAAQEATEVSGRAFGTYATGTLVVSEPNPEVVLPPQGGDVSDSAASILIQAEASPEEGEPLSGLVEVSASGNLEQGTATATATVNDLNLQELVSASLLRATSTRRCGPGGAQSSGSAVIEGLRILNLETHQMELVEVTGEPNQTIELQFEGGITNTFILNRQTGGDGDLTVDALYYRLTLDLGDGNEEYVAGEIVVASAKSDITCAAGDHQQQGGTKPTVPDNQQDGEDKDTDTGAGEDQQTGDNDTGSGDEQQVPNNQQDGEDKDTGSGAGDDVQDDAEDNVQDDQQGEMPEEMPETGAGGLAAGTTIPVGNAAAGLTMLAGAGYAVIRRR